MRQSIKMGTYLSPTEAGDVNVSIRGDGSVSGHNPGLPITSMSAIGPSQEAENPMHTFITFSTSLSAPPGLSTQPMTPPSPTLSMTSVSCSCCRM
jgi:hypothetical protein